MVSESEWQDQSWNWVPGQKSQQRRQQQGNYNSLVKLR